eukprot:1153862-Pelagomonas_calceolata.AAC.5
MSQMLQPPSYYEASILGKKPEHGKDQEGKPFSAFWQLRARTWHIRSYRWNGKVHFSMLRALTPQERKWQPPR